MKEIRDSASPWIVTHQDLEKQQLQEMLALMPAQRLALAEELLRLALDARRQQGSGMSQAEAKKSDK
jgi:hypothetical protein